MTTRREKVYSAVDAFTMTTTFASGAYQIESYEEGRLVLTTRYAADETELASTAYAYDAFGRQKLITDSRTGTTQITYYDNDVVASQIAPDPDGAGPLGVLETAYIYDSMGRQIQVILPDASSTYTEYNPLGQVTKRYGSQANPVEYTYDYAGRQKTMTTWQDFNESTATGISGDATTTWIYDSQRGWLNRKEYEDSEGTDYTYTAAGRLASRTWARGVTTHYAYNRAGDLLAVDYDDADGTPDVLYSYTRTGQQDEVQDGQFAAAPFMAGAILATAPALNSTRYTYAYGYNGEQQLETETVSGLLTADAVLTRAFEDGTETNGLVGRGAGYSLSTDGGTSTDAESIYTYDSAGRLKTVADGTDTFTYGYLADARNQLETMAGPVHTVTYSYEPGRNAMTNIENYRTVGGTGVVSNYAYTYNTLGQRAERAQSGSEITSSTDSFSYDSLGQVTGSTNDVETTADAWNPSYSFDMIGNRAGNTVDLNGTTAYVPDLLNQYDSVGGVVWDDSNDPSKGYDDDGNFIGDGIWSYTWNGENRLINADNGTVSIDFEYDYQGRLVKKDDGTDIVVYLYDGWNRIVTFEVLTSSFTLQTSYLWGLDLSGSMQGAGGVGGLLKEGDRYPTFDANGNIMQKLSSTGNVDMNVVYDPFGSIISGTLVGEYGFSAKPLIDQLDWYYYGFRYYDPVTGRWPSRDPIEERGGLNVYAMLNNGLVNRVDYLGQHPVAVALFDCAKSVLENILIDKLNKFIGTQDIAKNYIGPDAVQRPNKYSWREVELADYLEEKFAKDVTIASELKGCLLSYLNGQAAKKILGQFLSSGNVGDYLDPNSKYADILEGKISQGIDHSFAYLGTQLKNSFIKNRGLYAKYVNDKSDCFAPVEVFMRYDFQIPGFSESVSVERDVRKGKITYNSGTFGVASALELVPYNTN